jgi:hypothetical protein
MKKNLKKIGMFIFLLFAGLIFMTACSSDPTKISEKKINELVENARLSINEEFESTLHDNNEYITKDFKGLKEISLYYDKSRNKYLIIFSWSGTNNVMIQEDTNNIKKFKEIDEISAMEFIQKNQPFKTLDVEKE